MRPGRYNGRVTVPADFSDPAPLSEQVRQAHGDAWQAEGLVRVPYGGGVGRVRGARLMASGIRTPKWNNADITSGDPDLEALTDWYRARDLPWGIRVPLELDIGLGTPVFVKRSFGLRRLTADAVDMAGIEIRLATKDDLQAYVAVDSAAFGEDAGLSRQWVEPTLGHPGFNHWIAFSADQPVGVVEVVATDEEAGPAAMVGGLGVESGWEDRGIERQLAHRAIAHAFENGAKLVHAHDQDAKLCITLGFVEVPGFLIRVVRAT